jgi:putative FmdB family regulatory protein
MPLYEFRCTACGREFEALVRAGESKPCPACGCESVERLLSLFAVSSDETRQANLSAARRMAQGIARDKAVAEQEVAARHSHDDH